MTSLTHGPIIHFPVISHVNPRESIMMMKTVVISLYLLFRLEISHHRSLCLSQVLGVRLESKKLLFKNKFSYVKNGVFSVIMLKTEAN